MSVSHQYPQPVEILLVEDNAGDIELTQEALHDARIINRTHVARDGDEALDFLYQRGLFADAVRPDVILLDLNLPKKDGQEVLAVIKQDKTLKDIPVVILTSSASELDIVKSYKLHCNAYIVKPVDLKQFLKVVETVEDFWLSVVKLPPRQTQTDKA